MGIFLTHPITSLLFYDDDVIISETHKTLTEENRINTCALWLRRRALKLSSSRRLASEGVPCLPDEERREEAEVLPFACWGRCSMRSPGKGVPTRRKCRRRTFTSYRMGPTSTGTRSSTNP